MRLIDAGDVDASLADLTLYCNRMQASVKKVASAYEAGFNSALSSYGIIFDNVAPVRHSIATNDARLIESSQYVVGPSYLEISDVMKQLMKTENIISLEFD